MAIDETQNIEGHHKPVSWWQPIMGLSTMLLGLGIFFIAKGINDNGFSLKYNTPVPTANMTSVYEGLIFVILFFVVFALALYAETSPKRFKQDQEDYEERMKELVKHPRGFAKFSFIWVFLASEVLFFSLLIGSSIALRINTGGYNPNAAQPWDPAKQLNVPITAFNTFVLICSSYTMVKGLQCIEQGESKKGSYYLFATFFFGLMFVSIQANEYLGLWANGFRPDPTGVAKGINPLFPATFYIQTGFHGLHVFFGVFVMFFVALKAYRGGYTPENHDSVELIGYYWHFVDLVWIILFTVVYLF